MEKELAEYNRALKEMAEALTRLNESTIDKLGEMQNALIKIFEHLNKP